MKIFKAVVIRIDDVPAENSRFSQKEIIVIPYSPDRETATEYIAIPPSVFPTDVYGSGVVTLPEINQQCLVVETEGYRRVQILSYIPHSMTTSYGEYTPVDVTSGGAAFKIGGVKPMTMYFHKGGKFELFSNEFCKFYFDGGNRALHWTIDTEERVFAGGRVLNTLEEIDGIEKVTRHVEVYTKTFEWKQNSDTRISTEKSVFNPVTSIIPTSDYSYVPKAIIKAGTIVSEYDTNLGNIFGHLYEIETRQTTYSGDKDTITKLRLGRQNEFYKFDNNKVYPAGDIFEWTAKVAKVSNNSSQVTTHLLRYGFLEKDVIQNDTAVEFIEGEVFRNQTYINIYDTNAVPVTNNLAEGEGYEFDWFKKGAEQQYLISYGKFTSENLNGNSELLYKSAVREHFHSFENHSIEKITTPTGMSRDYILFFQDNNEKGLFSEKFIKWIDGEEKVSQKVLFTDVNYQFEQKIDQTFRNLIFNNQKLEQFISLSENLSKKEVIQVNLYENFIKLDGTTDKTENFTNQEYKTIIKLGEKTFNITFNASGEIKIELIGLQQKSPSIIMKENGIYISPGELSENIFLGEGEGLQQLVTKKWVETIFNNHIHPTTGIGTPTAPPVPLPEIPSIINSPTNIFTYKIKGE